MRLLFVACALIYASYSHAANISVDVLGANKAIVTIDGPLYADDRKQFTEKVGALSNAIVGLQSDGGSMLAGIQIGEAIRLKGFTTVVPTGARCASACALAWLGGTRRLMGSGAQIGFHSAYDMQSGREIGVANAVMGAYLNRIGLPYSAVIYITQAPPESMTISDAKKIGIDVALLQAEAGVPTVSILPPRAEPKRQALEPTERSLEEDKALRMAGWTQEQIDNMSAAIRARELRAIGPRQAEAKVEDAALRKAGWTQEQIDNMSPAIRARELHAIRGPQPDGKNNQSSRPEERNDHSSRSEDQGWLKRVLVWLGMG